MPSHSLNLVVLPDHLAVCRLPATAPLPTWGRRGFFSVTHTPDELSIVCAEADVPAGVQHVGGWRALKVEGPLPFEMVGVLAALAAPLAEAGVSIFALSTYDTDYLLVRGATLAPTVETLRAAGHRVVEEGTT